MADAIITLSQKPKTVNLDGHAGDYFSFVVKITEFDGSPAQLNDQHFISHIKVSHSRSEVLGVLDLEPEGDTLNCSLSADLAGSLPRRCVYDVEWVERRRTIFKGVINLDPEVTRVDYG